jgi:AcrR family transcriptional regulator
MVELRADAQRNLGRVLEAAAEALAEHGPDVSVDEIARRAGVGHGTVFRRFPTKDALLAAVVCNRLAEFTAELQVLLEREDAGPAFEEFVWQTAEVIVRDRAIFEGMSRCREFPEVAAAKEELDSLTGELVRRAQAQGALRRDIDASDVLALIGAAILGATQGSDRDAWRRYVMVVFDGLRASV